jgi:hypothetical protein
MAACKQRFPSNKFNFLRFRRVQGGTLSDLPINDLCPIVLFLGTPQSLTAEAIFSDQINISWSYVDQGQTGFEIQRSLTSGSGFVTIATVQDDIRSYEDTGLAPETTYYYRVRAVSDGLQSGYSNEASATTLFGIVFNTTYLPTVGNPFDLGASSSNNTKWKLPDGSIVEVDDLNITDSSSGLDGTQQQVLLGISDPDLITNITAIAILINLGLDLTRLRNVSQFRLEDNDLDSVDFTNAALVVVDNMRIEDANLTTLDFSGFTRIRTLDVARNDLTSIN